MSPDLTAEHRLIGAAMTFRTLLDNVTVDPGDFQDLRLGALWELMVQMRGKGRVVDPGSVLSSLNLIPKDQRVGIDAVVLADLHRAAPATANEGELAAQDVVNDAANRRIEMLGIRAQQIGSAGGDALANQETIRAELEAVTTTAPAEVRFVGETIDETIAEIENPTPAMPTPWRDLNYLMRGWRPGRLYVIGARPSVGKSVALLQAALHLARAGVVSFHSLEMPSDEVERRILAQVGQVALGKLEGRNPDNPDSVMHADDWDKVAKARAKVADLPLAIDDRGSVSVADIRARARQVSRHGPLAAVVVDYLQLLAAPRGMGGRNRAEVVGEFSRSLKLLARELNVPVIAAVQLNRNSVNRDDPRPTMADIRESGSVEQDSDNIILLHRQDNTHTDLDMLLVKQRQGPLGKAELTMQGHYARIIERGWNPSNHRLEGNAA